MRLALWRRMTLVVILAGAVGYVGYRLFAPPSHAADLRAAFGGPVGVEVVAHPDRVEAFRLAPIPESVPRSPGAIDDPANFPAASGPTSVPSRMADELGAVLTAPGCHLWFGPNSGKACGPPTPGVRLSFVRGAERVEALLCYRCAMALIYRGGASDGGPPL